MLPYHLELHTLLASSEICFYIIGITESMPKCDKNHPTNIAVLEYTTERCTTDGANGGALLYIKDNAVYQIRMARNFLKANCLTVFHWSI